MKKIEKMKKFDEKRVAIKHAGIKSFAAYGYYKTTLEDIANMLGMKKNSLYYYFDNKDALFREIIEDTVADHLDQTALISTKKISAEDKLMLIIQSISDFIRQRTLEFSITIASFIEIHQVIRNSFPDFQIRQAEVIEKILIKGVTDNEFFNINTSLLASDLSEIVPAIFGQHYLNSQSKFVSDLDFEEITAKIKRTIQYIINGIKRTKIDLGDLNAHK